MSDKTAPQMFFGQYPIRCVLFIQGEEVEVRGEFVENDDPWSLDYVITADEARRALREWRGR